MERIEEIVNELDELVDPPIFRWMAHRIRPLVKEAHTLLGLETGVDDAHVGDVSSMLGRW